MSDGPIDVVEKPGKTIHLLKSNPKPVPAQRARRKIQLLGTFGEYKESKKKVPDQVPLGLGQAQQQQPPIPASIMSLMVPQPNANAEGKNAKDAKMAKK